MFPQSCAGLVSAPCPRRGRSWDVRFDDSKDAKTYMDYPGVREDRQKLWVFSRGLARADEASNSPEWLERMAMGIFSLRWVSKEEIPKDDQSYQSIESMDRCWWSTFGLPKNPEVPSCLLWVCSKIGHFSAFHWLNIMFRFCLLVNPHFQTKSDMILLHSPAASKFHCPLSRRISDAQAMDGVCQLYEQSLKAEIVEVLRWAEMG